MSIRRTPAFVAVLVMLVPAAACRGDADPGAGGVPAGTPADTTAPPGGDVIDPSFTVDTQRIPGADTLSDP